jgi:hypothetical protein
VVGVISSILDRFWRPLPVKLPQLLPRSPVSADAGCLGFLEVKLQGLPQVGQGFFLGLALAADVDLDALGDE